MASLLRLYQQDAEARDPDLTRPLPSVVAWVDATKDYLDHLRERHDRLPEVSVKQKRTAAGCLNLAAQSLQIGATIQGDLEMPVFRTTQPDTEPTVRPFVITTILMLVVLLINLWVMSVAGVFSVFVLIVGFILLHRRDVGALERRLRSSGKTKRAAAKRSRFATNAHTATVGAHIESVVRGIDGIIDIDGIEQQAVLPPPIKAETLEFLQDILEAKLADDKDYAFKKISRTLVQVLLSEGIEVITDAQSHTPMFSIDTVTDDARAGQIETIRPALVKDAQCVMTGYAQQFVRA